MHLPRAASLPLVAALFLAPGLRADDGAHDSDDIAHAVYIQTNNPLPGKNAILAYTRNLTTGALTEMPGSPFLTDGTGNLNATEVLGPDDTDQEIVVTPDHRFLYCVNQGSNTIAAFVVQPNGSLQTIPGSPFNSGGVQPASIGLDGYLLFAMNRGDQNPGASTGTHKPDYSSFLILPNGALLPLPWQQPSLVAGSSPTQALVAPGGGLLFDANLFENPFNNAGEPPFIPPYSTELHSYKVNLIGQLTPAASITPPAMAPPFILGLQVHPTQKILYAGLVVAGALATYTYDDAGNLTLVGTTAGAPNGGLCWISVTADAKYIYAADAITNQIDVFSIGADPLHPVHGQPVNLNGAKALEDFPISASIWNTTPFQLKTTPEGTFLYVVNHEVSNLTGGNATGNTVHILQIGALGALTEIAGSPLTFPLNEVPMEAHPLGVVVF